MNRKTTLRCDSCEHVFESYGSDRSCPNCEYDPDDPNDVADREEDMDFLFRHYRIEGNDG